MMNRCYNFEDKKDFPLYGGRGISVHAAWHQFENFLKDMGERPPCSTLNRKDPDGDYTPDNCQWASYTQQAIDRRSTVFVELDGVRLHLRGWADLLGINYKSFYWRVRQRGAEEAIRYYQGQASRNHSCTQ